MSRFAECFRQLDVVVAHDAHQEHVQVTIAVFLHLHGLFRLFELSLQIKFDLELVSDSVSLLFQLLFEDLLHCLAFRLLLAFLINHPLLLS